LGAFSWGDNMTYQDLKNKRVLVTGASSGVGRAAALAFAKLDCFVGVHYLEAKDSAEKVMEQMNRQGGGCLLQADLSSSDAPADLASRFMEKAGGIDVLVNNAGSLISRVELAKVSAEDFDNIFSLNTRAPLLLTSALLSGLGQSKGSVVNVGSMAAFMGGSAGGALYAASKAALHQLTCGMAREFAPLGVRVNAVAPGVVDTRFHERFSAPGRLEKSARQIPLGRVARPEDIANVILYLASESAGFITGEIISANGGQHMRP
jgi:3-oxoacyl-[acyl-carrier protein] reductase